MSERKPVDAVLLATLKYKAEFCEPKGWILNADGDVIAIDFSSAPALVIAKVSFLEDAEFIAAADPGTVLALIDEIERLRHEAWKGEWAAYAEVRDRDWSWRIAEMVVGGATVLLMLLWIGYMGLMGNRKYAEQHKPSHSQLADPFEEPGEPRHGLGPD